MGIMAMIGASGGCRVVHSTYPPLTLSQVSIAPYQAVTRQAIAATKDVSALTKFWALGFNRLINISILICQSFFSSQAPTRKVIHSRLYSVISAMPVIGRRRKYLITISAVTPSVIRISITAAKAAKAARIWSKKAAILPGCLTLTTTLPPTSYHDRQQKDATALLLPGIKILRKLRSYMPDISRHLRYSSGLNFVSKASQLAS